MNDPASEVADEIADGTEIVLGNIGKVAVAAVEGGVRATKEATKGKEGGIIRIVFYFR